MTKSQNKSIFETLGRHPIHPFPARMSPGIALDALELCRPGSLVVDPMMGSGTVLAMALSLGHRAIGFDVDPLAVLLSRVWTTPVDANRAQDKAAEVVQRARALFADLSAYDAYPIGADDETKVFVRYWFDEYARRQLTALAKVVTRIHDHELRDVFWCALSRLIITKQAGASLAMDLSHSRPHKAFTRAPRKPLRTFASAVEAVAVNCANPDDAEASRRITASLGDARKLPIRKGSVDVVVTSPPYLNAIDYMRCSKFSLVWMGYHIPDLRAIRSSIIGTEVSLSANETSVEIDEILGDLKLQPKMSARDTAVLRRYARDMQKAVGEIARILIPGGKAVYVVGNSTIRGTFVRNSALVEATAVAKGLRLTRKTARLLPDSRRYLPPPCRSKVGASLSGRMRQEVVLTFERPKEG
jgi:DNA modification methylase